MQNNYLLNVDASKIEKRIHAEVMNIMAEKGYDYKHACIETMTKFWKPKVVPVKWNVLPALGDEVKFYGGIAGTGEGKVGAPLVKDLMEKNNISERHARAVARVIAYGAGPDTVERILKQGEGNAR
jgi:hypothetical protein